MLDPYEQAHAEALMHGYDARWAADMGKYEVIAVEVEFRTPLVNPETGAQSRTWQRGGKLDVLVREVAAPCRVVIVEHKSSGEDISTGSPYWRKLIMDGQVSSYFAGADALGHAADVCLYDVIGKVGIRPLKATPPESRRYRKTDGKLDARQREQDETPEEFFNRAIESIAAEPDAYYRRGDVVRLDADVAEALWDDWQLATQLREAQRASRFPRNPDACTLYNRPCEFFDVCTGLVTIDDRTRFRLSPVASPELAAPGPGDLPILSSSRLKAARRCQRYHKLSYIDCYRPVVEHENLRFGSLLHRGLEAWWSWWKMRGVADNLPESALEAAIRAIRTPGAAPKVEQLSPSTFNPS